MITPKSSAEHLANATDLAGGFFDPITKLGSLEGVGSDELPTDYQTLLDHSGHMTVTLEAWHESLVDVQTVAELHENNAYQRHSLLARKTDQRVVQSGVMRIELLSLPEKVREAIELGECPLGRILIRSNLLREVELLALWRIAAGEALASELSIPVNHVIYGRSARILVEGRPAVDLLEIVKP